MFIQSYFQTQHSKKWISPPKEFEDINSTEKRKHGRELATQSKSDNLDGNVGADVQVLVVKMHKRTSPAVATKPDSVYLQSLSIKYDESCGNKVSTATRMSP